MDETRREITKIAREVSKFTIRTLRPDGLGAGELDVLHAVRKHPGATQKEIRELLGLDKGAAARQTVSLESKGYLVRKANPADGRSQLLYATEKAQGLKNSKARVEALFYQWLLEELPQAERESFSTTLEKLYLRCKAESRAGFPEMTERVKEDICDEREN